MKILQFTIIAVLVIGFTSCNSSKEEPDKPVNEKVANGVNKNYIDGKLASEVTYKDGVKNGKAINYYPDGTINMEFNYKNGKKHGVYKWYHEDGTLYRESFYNEGLTDSTETIYQNGKIKSISHWKDDLPGIGLVEYKSNGEERNLPTIQVKKINEIKTKGIYTMELRLSDDSKKVKFFEGELVDGRYLPSYLEAVYVEDGVGKYVLSVPPGAIVEGTFNFVARKKMNSKNILVLQKEIYVRTN